MTDQQSRVTTNGDTMFDGPSTRIQARHNPGLWCNSRGWCRHCWSGDCHATKRQGERRQGTPTSYLMSDEPLRRRSPRREVDRQRAAQ